MPVVYIDLVWALNLVMDAVILYLVSFVCRQRVKMWRVLLSAALGALYAIMMLFPNMAALWSMVLKIGLSVLMVRLAFAVGSPKDFLQKLAVFYAMSFVLGGAVLALSTWLKADTVATADRIVSGGTEGWMLDVTVVALLVAVPATWGLVRVWSARVRFARRHEGGLWSLCISIDSHTAELPGLLDTGNQLRDPVSGSPVIVVTVEAVQTLLPTTLCAALSSGRDPVDCVADGGLDAQWQARLRIVPYRAVGTQNGLLLAIRPDEVTVKRADQSFSHERVLVALATKPLSPDGAYQAIVHPDLIAAGDAAS